MGLLALAAVAPILVYTFITFWGNNPEIDAAARALLVYVRIPPHAIVSEWFNATVVVKLGLIGAGLFPDPSYPAVLGAVRPVMPGDRLDARPGIYQE